MTDPPHTSSEASQRPKTDTFPAGTFIPPSFVATIQLPPAPVFTAENPILPADVLLRSSPSPRVRSATMSTSRKDAAAGPSDTIRMRARQIQRMAAHVPPVATAHLLTAEHLARARLLEPDASVQPGQELAWEPSWAVNAKSVTGLLSKPVWKALPCASDDEDDEDDEKDDENDDEADKNDHDGQSVANVGGRAVNTGGVHVNNNQPDDANNETVDEENDDGHHDHLNIHHPPAGHTNLPDLPELPDLHPTLQSAGHLINYLIRHPIGHQPVDQPVDRPDLQPSLQPAQNPGLQPIDETARPLQLAPQISRQPALLPSRPAEETPPGPQRRPLQTPLTPAPSATKSTRTNAEVQGDVHAYEGWVLRQARKWRKIEKQSK